MTPGMLTESERQSILSYVRNLRLNAKDDRRLAREATSPHRREHHLAERRNRIKEALRWRRTEREFRESTIQRELLRSQLKQSLGLREVWTP